MTSTLLEGLRQSRKSPAVLKARILSMRSREAKMPIFVFEGPEDIGAYSVWIGRCDDSLKFESLPASGKDQILMFRQNVQSHEAYPRANIYFFVDRDFDDLKGFAIGKDVFLTEKYSVENYLVSERVLRSILSDEFKCAEEPIDRALSLFHGVMESFVKSMSPANRRIFYARKLSIGSKSAGVEDRITKYVVIELETVRVVVGPDDLKILIPLEREPNTEEAQKLDYEFDKLDPYSRHRGKFILSFFLKWLDLLAAERSSAMRAIFPSSVRPRFSAQQLTMRSLATRSDIPQGLCDFVEQVDIDAAKNSDAGL